MNNVIISVILPVYNAEKYVSQALESISNQTFKDFEIIAINDGSTDNSLNIMQEYAKKEPRMRIISRENRGLVATLNEGIQQAKGKWIARMDADDISLPERFEKQLKFFEDNSDIKICGTFCRCFGNSNNILKYPTTSRGINEAMLFSCPLAHPTVMGDRNLFLENPYDITYEAAEDYELWARLALKSVKMANLDKVLLLYRVHTKQISYKNETQTKIAEKTAQYYFDNSLIYKTISLKEFRVKDLYKKDIDIDTFNKNIDVFYELKKIVTDEYLKGHIKEIIYKFFKHSANLGFKTIIPHLNLIDISMKNRIELYFRILRKSILA